MTYATFLLINWGMIALGAYAAQQHYRGLRIFNFGLAVSFGVGVYAAAIVLHQGGWWVTSAVAAMTMGATVQLFFLCAWSILPRVAFMFLSLLGLIASRSFPIIGTDPLAEPGSWANLTNGVIGLAVSPAAPDAIAEVAVWVVGIAAIMVIGATPALLSWRSSNVRLRALGDDPLLGETIGVMPIRDAALHFVALGWAFGAAGLLYVAAIGFVDPSIFSVAILLKSIAAYALGSRYGTAGIAIGALLVVLIPEVLRLGLGGVVQAGLEAAILGAIIATALLTGNRGSGGRGWR